MTNADDGLQIGAMLGVEGPTLGRPLAIRHFVKYESHTHDREPSESRSPFVLCPPSAIRACTIETYRALGAVAASRFNTGTYRFIFEPGTKCSPEPGMSSTRYPGNFAKTGSGRYYPHDRLDVNPRKVIRALWKFGRTQSLRFDVGLLMQVLPILI